MAEAVLIVEDDWDLRAMMEQTLHLEGFAPFVASNGKVALEILRSGAPIKIILLDLMMPIMDGYQFRSELMRDPSLASIPVIVISADSSVAEKAARMGATAYLRKPIEVDALLHTLERCCVA